MVNLTVVGGGLAGSEAAWQAAERGIKVKLYEMRPKRQTGAHVTADLAELVCSNSLGSKIPDRATGLLQEEIRRMGSLLMTCADDASVPAGGALAVDRNVFSSCVTNKLSGHPNISIIREEVLDIPSGPVVIASGPLTSDSLAKSIEKISEAKHLYFFDAISPIINLDSIDFSIAYKGSRYGRGELDEGDYINCPLNEQEYFDFVDAISKAERIELKSFELVIEAGVKAGVHQFFEGCLPVEIIAQRGKDSLAFGPMRPVGLIDPRTGKRPHAVLQLRQDNLAGTLYNIVGFQTNLTFPEQRRVFRMIPGLQNATFARYGQMHRNTFIYSPELINPALQFKSRKDLFFAGQITGVEGYVGNIATGLLAGVNASRKILSQSLLELPNTTMLGALCHYITHADAADFQPMKANFGILPPITDGKKRNKRDRAKEYTRRALEDLDLFILASGFSFS